MPDMDPDLAALLGTSTGANVPIPDFNDIFGDKNKKAGSSNETQVNLSVTGFPEVKKILEEKPHKFFDDPTYYKTALSNESDVSQRVHSILQKYLTSKDPKDKSLFRQQFITPFWDFLMSVSRKATTNMHPSKKYLLRFGMLHPNFISKETREYFSKIVVENELDQPVYYLDEWLKAVGTNVMRPSTTDEVRIARGNAPSKLMELLEKAKGKLDSARVMVRQRDTERNNIEKMVQSRINATFQHSPMREINECSESMTESQKLAINEIQNLLKDLLKNDRDFEASVKDYITAESDVQAISEKLDAEGGATTVDIGAIDAEFNTVRQMAKMVCGRQGNHFPVLIGEYFHCTPMDVATRENVIKMLAKIESIDSEAFCRVYKNKLNRISPYVLLLPSYGDSGVCWEPFERNNRATSRGRIVIPMYPKNLYLAVLNAVGDLRWQVAKEKASFYWMEEGLTGNYYQWFQAEKLKGDIKEYFINDYILWMTKEAEGIQKLPKDVRGAFWRFMPFTREVKEKLKTRSYVYQELFQRDINRTMSDGY